MSTDPVFMALRAAVVVSDGAELRMALAMRLLDLGQPAEALAEVERALGFEPTNREALALAGRAAEGAGETERAHAYRLALSAQTVTTSQSSALLPRNVTSNKSGASASPPKLRLVTAGDQAIVTKTAAITFQDVGGLDDVKQRLERSFLLPLRKPELFAKFEKSMRGGLLLYGPPGCGKTFIARALAGEIGARFVSIGLSDVLDMWLGESERKLHDLFENARRQAPTLLFFDEVDALGQRRTQLKNSAGRNVVNQFLAELDGVEGKNRDVFVLGATNHPWDIDPALRRPGRFGRMVFVPAPDSPARQRILALKLAERPAASGLDMVALAAATDGFSGADLEALVDGATELAFERTVTSGRDHLVDCNS
jgi:SpoVK/Ycf46/Vps4 family AAA+-type ATPase